MMPRITVDQLKTDAEHAINSRDLEGIKELSQYFTTGDNGLKPFSAAIQFDPDKVVADVATEAAIAIPLANTLSRVGRDIEFQSRIYDGYDGPIIVTEGDSYFQYPFILDDIVDNLIELYAVRSLGAAGDELAEIISNNEYTSVIKEVDADFFLISGGGNDMLGSGRLKRFLHEYEPGMTPAQLIHRQRFEQFKLNITQHYDSLFSQLTNQFPRLRILCHGYDYALPRSGGKWLGRPLQERGVPRELHNSIIRILIDEFNDILEEAQKRYPARVFHVDIREQIGPNQNSWHDELHPKNPGYKRAAKQFQEIIERLRTSIPLTPSSQGNVPNNLGANEAIIAAPRPYTSRHSTNPSRDGQWDRLSTEELDAYRHVMLLQTQAYESPARIENRRRMLPTEGADATAYERIIGKSNIFPINYLERGQQASRAVCRVDVINRYGTLSSHGTGFIIGDGLIITNNHVISDQASATRSSVVFDYAFDADFNDLPRERFDITDEVFITSKPLDFTVFSVKHHSRLGKPLKEYGFLKLIADSGKGIVDESVSIIQHPDGMPKQIALRDSRVIGVQDDFIYYTTDTNPGSSGSPVLNDQWLPVAVHHMAVPDPAAQGKFVANRGIRISRIITYLQTQAGFGNSEAKQIIDTIGISSQTEATDTATTFQPTNTITSDPLPIAEAAFTTARWDDVIGYNPQFLDTHIPLPLPNDHTRILPTNDGHQLRYHHFSVVMEKERNLPSVTAVNLDGSQFQRMNRRGRWRFDPRIATTDQTGNDCYKNNDLDRGHMVRRVTPMWGPESIARKAEADTFHYTNCAPQHARLNQGIWLDLEDYMVDWAIDHDLKMSIFTGPIFRADDMVYRGKYKIPAEFWKVAVVPETTVNCGYRAVAYLHTQKNLLPDLLEAFGDYSTFRVPIRMIADLSGIDFSPLFPFDVHQTNDDSLESTTGIMRLQGPYDLGFN